MAYINLDLNYNRKTKAILDTVNEFSMEIMRPAGIELDKLHDPSEVIAKDSCLWDVFKKHRELGLHAIMIPKAFGGMMEKMTPVTMSLMSEQLGYADSGLAVSLAVSSMPFAFAVLSKDAKIRNWAREYAEDKDANMVGCWAITEPDHGSDWVLGTTEVGNDPKTGPGLTAVKKGDEYILNGWKAAWVSNGTIATHAVLHVGLDPAMGMHGSGIALCPLDLPGISKAKPLNKIGQRPLNQGEIIFDEVKLHKRHMLIPVPGIFSANTFGRAFLGTANSLMGLTFSGLARAAFDEALKYSRENTRYGVPLAEQEDVKIRLFRMFAKVESARLLARKVAEHPRNSGPAANAIGSLFTSMKP
ncbi:MAG: acyl-CoA/acyl-ACP dehydrogenase, partial [Desulfobacterales bacterium]|nr:acyl-CoA/acyl-ACP dehydrogenase [Desulfobacterales bacterium]